MARSIVEECLRICGLDVEPGVQDGFCGESGTLIYLQVQECDGLSGVFHGEIDVSDLAVEMF